MDDLFKLLDIDKSEWLEDINSLHPRVRKPNFPCNDDNVAFMQQVHSKTTYWKTKRLINSLIT